MKTAFLKNQSFKQLVNVGEVFVQRKIKPSVSITLKNPSLLFLNLVLFFWAFRGGKHCLFFLY